MARLYNTFEFIGNIHIPSDSSKFHDVRESDSGWEGHRLNFAVKESNTNSAYVELYGGYSKSKPNKVFTFSKGTENEKGSKLEIPWEDRLKPETLEMVADFKKIVIDFTLDQDVKEEVNKLLYEIRSIEYKDQKTHEDVAKLWELQKKVSEKAPERYEFIHNYDAVLLLAEKLEEYKEHKFKLTGSIDLSENKGNFYRKFFIETLEIVPNDTPSKLRANMDIYFTKKSIDEKDFKKDQKVYINGHVIGYENKAKKDQFFPQQFVINAQKIDFENEQQVKLFNYLKNKFNVSGKGVYHLQWEVNIFRGADRLEFSEKDLTVQQKEEIELGLRKLEDFAPKGGVLGDTVYENRLVKPISKKVDDHNDFSSGAVETNYKEEDLEFVFTTPTAKKQEETKEEVKTETTTKIDIESELDNLFG